jgi:hypothetical protein
MPDSCYHNLTAAAKCTVYICLTLFLQSCNTKKQDTTEAPAVRQVDTLLRDQVLGSVRSSPITDRLYNNGLPFRRDLLHNTDLTDRYLKKANKHIAAANLGIYLSDLTYVMGFGELEEGKRYFESCYRISEYVGMKKQLGNAIQTGFAAILENDTTLQTTVQSIFDDAANNASGEDFKKLHITALTGYYIEELYHLVSLLQTQPPLPDSVAVNILAVVSDQSQELNNLIGCFDHVHMKQEGIPVYQDLLSLQAQYLALDRERTNKQALKINDKRLTGIFNTITSIRTAIINP